MNQRDFQRDREHAYKCGVSPVLAGQSASSESGGSGTRRSDNYSGSGYSNGSRSVSGDGGSPTDPSDRKDWAA